MLKSGNLAFTASIITLTTLSLARYFSICKPFSSQARYISKSYKRIIQIIWCLAIIIQIPSTATYNLQKDQCINNRWGSRNRLIIYAIHSAILFLTPLALTTASHLAITLYLYRHNTLISTISYRSSSTSSSGTIHIHHLKKNVKRDQNRKLTKLLSVLSLTFFICWFPFILVRLLKYTGTQLNAKIWPSTQVLLIINTAINPFIYGFCRKA